MKPIAELVDPRAMRTAERDELWQFFSGIVQRSRENFERTLQTFPEVRIWRHRDTHALLGFSASQWLDVEVAGRVVPVVYVGWAAVAPELRSRGLAYRDGLVRYGWQALLRRGPAPLMVFGASTYKSYRSLVRYAPAAWPQPERPMPPHVGAVIEHVMRAKEETQYDAQVGVIRRFGRQRYREGVYADTPEVLADPLVAYYAACNPRQHEGDSLLVAYELSARNMLRSAWLFLRRKPLARRPAAVARPAPTPPSVEAVDAGVETAEA